MGNKERPDELAGRSGGRRAGNEVEEAVQSEDEKDESKKETSDDSYYFHVSYFCLIYSILTSIQSVSNYNWNEAEKNNKARRHRRACLARFHESLSSAVPARSAEH